jgi:hypothetical protein
MGGDVMARLLTPSPIMLWLLLLLPATIALSGILGAAERETGNRRLALWALLLVIWLFLPLHPADPMAAEVTGAVSILGWLGLVGYWARHVWVNRPTPVWTHALVITHLVAIAVGGIVALLRALMYVPPG